MRDCCDNGLEQGDDEYREVHGDLGSDLKSRLVAGNWVLLRKK